MKTIFGGILICLAFIVAKGQEEVPSWDCSDMDKLYANEIWKTLWHGTYSGRRSNYATIFIHRLFDLEPNARRLFLRKYHGLEDVGNTQQLLLYVLVLQGMDMKYTFSFRRDVLELELKHTGEGHAALEGMEAEYFDKFVQASIDILPQILNDFKVDAWTNCSKGWASKIKEAFKQKREESTVTENDKDS